MPKTKYRRWLEDVAGIRGWNIQEMLKVIQSIA